MYLLDIRLVRFILINIAILTVGFAEAVYLESFGLGCPIAIYEENPYAVIAVYSILTAVCIVKTLSNKIVEMVCLEILFGMLVYTLIFDMDLPWLIALNCFSPMNLGLLMIGTLIFLFMNIYYVASILQLIRGAEETC